MITDILITGDYTIEEGAKAIYLRDSDGDVIVMMIKSEPGDPTTQRIRTEEN